MKLSIIVPIFNKEKYIETCLESLLKQQFTDFELICIDDGSTDSSGIIIDNYTKRDKRIKSVHKKNGGQVSARKLGVEMASSKYVGFVDADDWVDYEMFGTMVNFAEKENVDLVSSGIIYEKKILFDSLTEGIFEDDSFDELFKKLLPVGYNSSPAILGNVVTKIFRTDILKETIKEIPDEVHYREDDCLVFSYLLKCNRLGILRKAFYHYRYDAASDSHKIDDRFFMRLNFAYLFLKETFDRSKYKDIIRNQLELYYCSTIVNALKRMDGTADSIISVSFPIIDAKRILIYGAGKHGRRIAARIEKSENHKLIGIVDRDYNKIEGCKYVIYSPQSIIDLDYDVLLIAILNDNVSMEVKKQLISMGADEEKIYIV